jgi:hypothetical protein
LIQVIKRVHERNVGDRMADPQAYFSFSNPVQTVCLHSLFESEAFDPKRPAILGGGGLDYWRGKLKRIAETKRHKVATWGMGLNRHFSAWEDAFPSWYQDFDLNGVRDHGHGLPYVPCVSCLHPAFRVEYPLLYEVVAFEHFEKPLGIPGVPVLDNSAEFSEAIRFLGGARSVITNTYHGLYWATLLGKRVVVFPLDGSSRFYFMKYPPVFSSLSDWRDDLTRARAYPESLEESTRLNLEHAEKVGECLGVDIRPKQITL